MNAPGKGMLKVTSILFIVFGAIATLFSIIALIGSAALTSIAGQIDEGSGIVAAAGSMLLVASIILIVSSLLELFIGIFGVGKSADPAKANYFIVTGIVLCALTLVSMIMNFSALSLIGFVLPILYIIGGFQNKKAAAPAAPAAQ
jgi:hypothetical protein